MNFDCVGRFPADEFSRCLVMLAKFGSDVRFEWTLEERQRLVMSSRGNIGSVTISVVASNELSIISNGSKEFSVG